MNQAIAQEYRAEADEERERAIEAETELARWKEAFPGKTPDEVAGEIEELKTIKPYMTEQTQQKGAA